MKMPDDSTYQNGADDCENIEGPFYCEKDLCLACRLPEQEAPDLIGFWEAPQPGLCHCYFKKHPSTPDDVQRAIRALSICCSGALRYAGNDPAILQRLTDSGIEQQCDDFLSR